MPLCPLDMRAECLIIYLKQNRYFMMVMATERDNQLILERELLPVIDALYNFAYHLTGDRTEADDLVQETYLRAIKAIASYQEGSNPKAWLFKILKNFFINEYRRQMRRPKEVDFENVIGILKEEESDSGRDYLSADVDAWEEILSDEIVLALQNLRDEYRIVLIMADLEDFKYEEIAEMLDIRIGTVRSRLHRARNTLSKQLDHYAAENGYTNHRRSN